MKTLIAVIVAIITIGCATNQPQGDMERHLICVGFADGMASVGHVLEKMGYGFDQRAYILGLSAAMNEFGFTQDEFKTANDTLRSIIGPVEDGDL